MSAYDAAPARAGPAVKPQATARGVRWAAARPRPGLALVVLVVLVLTAACQGAPSVVPAPGFAAPTPHPSPTPLPPAADRPLHPVVIAQSSQGFLYLPVDVARERGYFRAEGLDVQVWNYAGGDLARQAVESGEAQVSDTAMLHVLAARERGVALTAFAALQTEFALNLVMTTAALQSTGVTERSTAYEKIAALRGLRIGISSPGSSSDQLPRYLLRRAGFEPERAATYVALGKIDSILTALTTGAIDAAFLPSPYGELAVRRGVGAITLELTRGELPELRGYLYSVLYARQDYLDTNAEVAAGLVRAIMRAQQWMHEDQAGLLTIIRRAFPEADDVVLRWSIEYNLPSFPRDARITERGLATAVEWYNAGRALPVRFDPALIATNRFVDLALARLTAGEARP